MKILLVAPQSPDTILGTIGGYCQNALISLGHDVDVFDFRESQYLTSSSGRFLKNIIKKIFKAPTQQIPFADSLQTQKMNSRLKVRAERTKPDILFVLMGDTISPEILRKIKKLGITTVNWFHDSVLAPIRKDFIRECAGYYDYFFMIDSEDILKHYTIDSRFVKTIPLGCEPAVHRTVQLTKQEKRTYSSDISFIGTVKFKRKFVLEQLADFDLKIWGYWLEKIEKLKKNYRQQHIFGEDAVKIYNASKIVLDIHLSYGSANNQYNVTPRVFEVPASGAFLLVNENPMLSKFYEIGTEVVSYKDEQDLKRLVKYYLKNPEERETIAKNGQQKAHKKHTYKKRLEDIISIIQKNG